MTSWQLVRLLAGTFILLSLALGIPGSPVFVSPWFLAFTAFVGVNLLGLVLIGLAATGTVGWWGWLGVIPLLTSVFRFCPAYTLIGVNTCPMKK